MTRLVITVLTVLLLGSLARAEILGFHGLTNATVDLFAASDSSTSAGAINNAGRVAILWPGTTTTVDQLRCSSSQAPGGGNSWVITAYTDPLADGNFAASSLTCTMSGASQTSCADGTHTGPLPNAGSIAWRVTPSGSVPAGAVIQCGVRESNNSFALLHAENINMPTTGDQFAMGTIQGTTEIHMLVPLPPSSTLQKFYCAVNNPPTSGTWTCRVRKTSGGEVTSPISDTTLVCSISGSSTTCNDLIDTVSLLGSQNLLVKCSATAGTPAPGVFGRCAFQGP